MQREPAAENWRIALWMAISSTLGGLLLATSLAGDLVVALDFPAHVAYVDHQITPEFAVFVGVALPSLACIAWFALYLSASRRPAPIGLTCTLTIFAIAAGGLSAINGVNELKAEASHPTVVTGPPRHPAQTGKHKSGASTKTHGKATNAGASTHLTRSAPAPSSTTPSSTARAADCCSQTPASKPSSSVTPGSGAASSAQPEAREEPKPESSATSTVNQSEQQSQNQTPGGEQTQSQQQTAQSTYPGTLTVSQEQSEQQSGEGTQSQSQSQSSAQVTLE
jgi:hypothetical protein